MLSDPKLSFCSFTLVITIQRLFSYPIFLVLDFLHSRQQVILTLFKRSSVPGQYIYKKDGMSIYKDVSNDNLIDTFSSNLIKVKINHSLIKERWKFNFPLRIFLGQTTNQPTNQSTDLPTIQPTVQSTDGHDSSKGSYTSNNQPKNISPKQKMFKSTKKYCL